MITMNDDGSATVQGVGNIGIPNLTERKLAMDEPVEAHGVDSLGNALGLSGVDTRMKTMLDHDNSYTRQRRSNAYDQLLAVAAGPLADSVSKARKIGENTDLKDEIRTKRVAEAIEESWPNAEKRLTAIEVDSRKAVLLAEAVYRSAWTLPDETDMGVQTLLDREVRDALRGMDANQRIQAIFQAAEEGRLEIFRVLEADPMGQLAASLPGDTLERGKALALDKAGLGWVQVMRDDAQADAEHISTMIELLKGGIAADLKRTFNAEVNLDSNPTPYRRAA